MSYAAVFRPLPVHTYTPLTLITTYILTTHRESTSILWFSRFLVWEKYENECMGKIFIFPRRWPLFYFVLHKIMNIYEQRKGWVCFFFTEKSGESMQFFKCVWTLLIYFCPGVQAKEGNWFLKPSSQMTSYIIDQPVIEKVAYSFSERDFCLNYG